VTSLGSCPIMGFDITGVLLPQLVRGNFTAVLVNLGSRNKTKNNERIRKTLCQITIKRKRNGFKGGERTCCRCVCVCLQFPLSGSHSSCSCFCASQISSEYRTPGLGKLT
jgi:hypothetical protein